MNRKFVAALAALVVVAVVAGAQLASAASGRHRANVSGALTPGGILTGAHAGAAHVLADTAPTALLNTAKSLGAFASSTRLKVMLPLALPNQAALTSFVSDEYDKRSPDYRHFLKPAQFAARFGAPAAEIDSVQAALAKLGLTSAEPSSTHLYMTVTAPVSALSAVFKTPIDRFAAAKPLGILGVKQFFSNTRNVTLPGSLSGLVTGVIGLSDADAPQPDLAPDHFTKAQFAADKLKTAAALRRGAAAAATRRASAGGLGFSGVGAAAGAAAAPAATTPVGIDGGATPCAQAVAGAGYTAPQLAAGYDFDGMYAKGYHGEGMSIALVEFDDFHDSNLSTMESCYDESTPVTRRLVDGGVGGPPAEGEAEDMADITTVLEMLPQLAHLYVYEAPADGGLGTPTDEGDAELDLYNAFVTDDLAPVISSSWGNCEQFNSAAYQSLLGDIAEEAAAQGQQIYDAAGDSGAVDCRGYPDPIGSSLSVEGESAIPWITGVGGTDLSVESTVPDSGIHNEDPWNDDGAGGGGQSSVWSMPAWQQSYLTATGDKVSGLGGNCNSNVVIGGVQYCRMVPDIALDADNDAGGALGGSPLPPDFAEDGDVGSPGYSVYCGTSNCSLAGVLTGEPIPAVPGGVGGWEPIGGTSLATPLAASAAVLWDQEAEADGLKGGTGFLNPDFYQVAANKTEYASDFHDITTGSNSDQYGGCTAPACNPKELYAAGTGYDMASGLGSIDVANLGADLIKNAATLDVTPGTEAMYGYTSDPHNASAPGPETTAPISVTGGAVDASYTATSSASWLQVTSPGTAPGSLSWDVDPAGLAAGTYTGTITINDPVAAAAGVAPAVVTVTYTVTAPAHIAVSSPTDLKFSEPAVTDAGAATTATCGSTYWGDELLNADNSANGNTATTYNAPASSLGSVDIANSGPSSSQLHYEVDYVADTGAWLSTDLEDGLSGTGTTATQTTPNQTTVTQPLVPTNGTLSGGNSASVPLASVANGNGLGGYPLMNQGTYTGLVQVVDLADPADTVTLPASTVLGTGAGTPTMAWDLNGAGASDAPIQVTAAPGASTSFNLVLSDASKVCGYAYSLGVANIDGSEDPDATPSAAFLSVSSPYLQAGTVPATAATAAPTSDTDTGSGNGYTPIDVTAPSSPGTYQGYIVVDSQNAQGVATYGPANLGGGPANGETGNPGSSPLGAPSAPASGDPMFIPICLTVASGTATASSTTGSSGQCPISTGTPASGSSGFAGTGSGSTKTSTTTVTTTTTTPGKTTTTSKTTNVSRCKVAKRLVYIQHPAFPVVETKAIVYVNRKRVKTIRSRQIYQVALTRPKAAKFTLKYVAYLDDGEVVSHQVTYNGCKVSKQVYRVLHKPDRRIPVVRR